MLEVTPIHETDQKAVTTEVQRYLALASDLYDRHFSSIPVLFDLRGQAAGMYKVGLQTSPFAKRQRLIRFNPWLFAKYSEDSWSNTIPHEVAHYICDCLYGFQHIKPHGKEWRQIMIDFGAEPLVRASYDLDGIPHRRLSSFNYRCACRQVALSIHRHKKVQAGIQRYRCLDCHHPLEFVR